MDTIVDYLKQLDLSDVEAKLYFTLLQSGPISVRDLARTVEIKRTTAYFYIDQLVEKGLIMKLVKGSKKLVAANDPEELKTLVEAKVAKALTIKNTFPDVLQTLNTTLSQGENKNDAEIRYYKGVNGVKKIYEEVLKANEIRSYVNFKSGITFPEIEKLFLKAFKDNPNLIMYELLADTPASRTYAPLHNKRYFRKFIPESVKLSTADTLIYDGKVAIINFENKVVGTVLHNTDYYINSKGLFDFVWKLLPATNL